MENYQSYLDPRTLASLEGLDLQARLVVEGYVAGMHPSPYHGFSVEFAEHREYVPGRRHPPRRLEGLVQDRQVLPEAVRGGDEPPAYLLLDTSESMAYASERQRLEAQVRPVRRRGAGVPGAPAAGLGRPGALRRPGPAVPQAVGPAVAPEGVDPRAWTSPRRAEKSDMGADAARPGRAVQAARGDRRSSRTCSTIRRTIFAGPEALPPPPPRGDRLPHPRPRRDRLPVPQIRRCSRGWRASPTCSPTPTPCVAAYQEELDGVPRRAQEGVPDDRHRLRSAADRPEPGRRRSRPTWRRGRPGSASDERAPVFAVGLFGNGSPRCRFIDCT